MILPPMISHRTDSLFSFAPLVRSFQLCRSFVRLHVHLPALSICWSNPSTRLTASTPAEVSLVTSPRPSNWSATIFRTISALVPHLDSIRGRTSPSYPTALRYQLLLLSSNL